MRIAYIIFDGITWLDLIGVYEPISKLQTNQFLAGLQWDVCGYTERCKDKFGFEVNASKVRNDLSNYDAIIVPGGPGTRQLQGDNLFIDWLRTAAPVKYKISVCTGSLLLGAAGFLTDRKATTNFNEYETLKPYCKEVVDHRLVEDGDAITAGAVTASIDLGLYLCKIWAGDEAEKIVRQKIDYRC